MHDIAQYVHALAWLHDVIFRVDCKLSPEGPNAGPASGPLAPAMPGRSRDRWD